MSIKCCGTTHVTPFCPHCGKQLCDNNSIYGLLKHCADRVRRAETDLSRIQSGDHTDYTERGRAEASAHKTLVKWRSWHGALSNLIETENEY